MPMALTVAIGGLGAIGSTVAKALDPAGGHGGIDGLRLVAVSERDADRRAAALAGISAPPDVVELEELGALADVVVEALPAAAFERIALAALNAGRVLVPCSVGALLPRMHLVRLAQEKGGRIVVPTGSLLGLDAVRACAEGPVESVTIETRKSPRSLLGAPYLARNGIDVLAISEPTCIFEGNALDAAAGFPANVNVAAALALAGIGAARTRVQIWADPLVERNIHTIRVEAEAARLAMTVEAVPSELNPRTGKLAPLSVIACLRGLVSPLRVGS
jgi:aspartate dehydrogenase